MCSRSGAGVSPRSKPVVRPGTAHSNTVGAGGQMRVQNRMQVFATRRESNRAWLLHASTSTASVVAASDKKQKRVAPSKSSSDCCVFVKAEVSGRLGPLLVLLGPIGQGVPAAAVRWCAASGCARALVLEEEPDHLGGRVRAVRVGVGASRTAAVPGVTAAVDDQGLRDGDPVDDCGARCGCSRARCRCAS